LSTLTENVESKPKPASRPVKPQLEPAPEPIEATIVQDAFAAEPLEPDPLATLRASYSDLVQAYITVEEIDILLTKRRVDYEQARFYAKPGELLPLAILNAMRELEDLKLQLQNPRKRSKRTKHGA
jgi:hypothetical protein